MSGRLIIDGPRGGSWNMAVDESLLHSTADSAEWTLRFYRWSEPVLSLGYFQEFATRTSHDASRPITCVRRSTGGGAIVHDQELTYSLACPASQRWSRENEELYFTVHRAIRDSLAEQKIVVDLFPETQPRELQSGKTIKSAGDNRREPFLCFQRRVHGDVVFANASDQSNPDYKVCGSAQRRHKNSVLQHGSLIFRTSQSAPEIHGLLDLAKRELDEDTFIESLVNRLQIELGVVFTRAELTNTERARATEIQESKFAAASWTQKR